MVAPIGTTGRKFVGQRNCQSQFQWEIIESNRRAKFEETISCLGQIAAKAFYTSVFVLQKLERIFTTSENL